MLTEAGEELSAQPACQARRERESERDQPSLLSQCEGTHTEGGATEDEAVPFIDFRLPCVTAND